MARVLVISLVALFLGIVAVVLSFFAYSHRIKHEDVEMRGGSCRYPSSPAFALGIIAAVFLLVEQTVISAGTGCFCCRGTPCPSGCRGITALVLFVLSWLAFVVAFIGLVYTATLNRRSYLEGYALNDDKTCYIGEETLFLGAAIWCIISIVPGLLSYLLVGGYESRSRGGGFANEQGVSMVQPQMQPVK